jgi:hypothetical protein
MCLFSLVVVFVCSVCPFLHQISSSLSQNKTLPFNISVFHSEWLSNITQINLPPQPHSSKLYVLLTKSFQLGHHRSPLSHQSHQRKLLLRLPPNQALSTPQKPLLPPLNLHHHSPIFTPISTPRGQPVAVAAAVVVGVRRQEGCLIPVNLVTNVAQHTILLLVTMIHILAGTHSTNHLHLHPVVVVVVVVVDQREGVHTTLPQRAVGLAAVPIYSSSINRRLWREKRGDNENSKRWVKFTKHPASAFVRSITVEIFIDIAFQHIILHVQVMIMMTPTSVFLTVLVYSHRRRRELPSAVANIPGLLRLLLQRGTPTAAATCPLHHHQQSNPPHIATAEHLTPPPVRMELAARGTTSPPVTPGTPPEAVVVVVVGVVVVAVAVEVEIRTRNTHIHLVFPLQQDYESLHLTPPQQKFSGTPRQLPVRVAPGSSVVCRIMWS